MQHDAQFLLPHPHLNFDNIPNEKLTKNACITSSVSMKDDEFCHRKDDETDEENFIVKTFNT